MAARIVSIVRSLPLAACPPVVKAAPTLSRILNSGKTPNLSCQSSKNVLTWPAMLDQYTGEPTIRASAENRSAAVTFPTGLRTTVVPGTACAPATTPLAIFSVWPVTEWYVTNTLMFGEDSAASPSCCSTGENQTNATSRIHVAHRTPLAMMSRNSETGEILQTDF